MKTVNKNNNTNWYEAVYDFFGCTKTITVNGEKVKLVYDMINFNRANREHNCDCDLVIDGVKVGHVYYDIATGSYVFNGISFNTEKAALEYAYSIKDRNDEEKEPETTVDAETEPIIEIEKIREDIKVLNRINGKDGIGYAITETNDIIKYEECDEIGNPCKVVFVYDKRTKKCIK